jgi:glutamate-1-semialdehyde 2,1-aminomutase
VNLAQELFQSASQVLPGGVCASYRSNEAIGRPFFISHADGPYVYDLDGREYVDMCMSHGAALVGHNHPAVKAAVAKGLELGIACSYETEYQSALARKITQLVPGAEMVRFAGSGTETVMHALRLARAATGREKILKFEGHFNGYADYVSYSYGPPLDQAGPPDRPVPYAQSAGIPSVLGDLVLVVPFNSPRALETAFAEHGDEIACLVMEPISYDMGCVEAQPGFLALCQALCREHGALLFFDEVLTAFRMAPGGAQEHLGLTADLCVLGKALGGGMPISAIAGPQALMSHFRPLGKCEHSGTYLAHTTAVLAAIAALDEYARPEFYEHLDALGDQFYGGFQEIIERSGVPMRLQHVGARFGMHFGHGDPVTDYRGAARANRAMLLRFVQGCIERGVYFHVAVHHGYSAAHTAADIDRALKAIEGAMADVASDFCEGTV